jgi:uncharacterized SAM-binding protein YcdF (DUF218 family)
VYSFIKTLLINFLFPLPLSLGIISLGVFLLWFPGRQKIGRAVVTAGLIFLLFCSLPFVPNLILGHLERQYDHPDTNRTIGKIPPDVRYVVVLAGGHVLDSNVPMTSQFTYSGLVRCVEGIRLHKLISGSKLILSGGPGVDPVTDAELMAHLAEDLGVSRADLILESESKNTRDEAILLQPVVGSEPFVLVTSASHMTRAMALFKKLGMNPIPAPTDHLVKSYNDRISIFPTAMNVIKSDTLVYEYLGLLKEQIDGNI